MSVQKAVIKEVEKFNDSIIRTLDTKNISNTREAARSLRVEYGKDFVRSIGIFYLEFLDTGRGPGKFPPISPLIDWAKVKFGANEEEAKQIAFAVSHKIKKLGTEIFRNNKKGIELDKKILTLRKAIIEAISEEAKIEIEQKLDRFKKKFKNLKYQL